MAQIIKQPNGKYCIFNSIVDNITHYDMTPDEIIEVFLEEKKLEITEKVNRIVSKIEKGERPYYQFTLSYEEVLENIKNIHGEKEKLKIKAIIENSEDNCNL